MKIKLSIIGILFSTYIIGQNPSYKNIGNDYCEHIKNVNWKDLTKEQSSNEFLTISQIVEESQADLISQIKSTIKGKNPSYSQLDIEEEFNAVLNKKIAEYCDEFVIFSRGRLNSCPLKNRSLELTSQAIDNLLLQSKAISYTEKQSMVDEYLFEYSKQIVKQINKDYSDGLMGYVNEIQLYMMHNSLEFYRMYIITYKSPVKCGEVETISF